VRDAERGQPAGGLTGKPAARVRPDTAGSDSAARKGLDKFSTPISSQVRRLFGTRDLMPSWIPRGVPPSGDARAVGETSWRHGNIVAAPSRQQLRRKAVQPDLANAAQADGGAMRDAKSQSCL
jgi:hypothetical protein